jgi:Flp pilus assembly protein TadB
MRRTRFYSHRMGRRMVAMAFALPAILSFYAAFYGAWLYWVALLTVVYAATVWPALGIRAIVRYTVRKHNARRYAR